MARKKKRYFDPVDTRVSFPCFEEKILKYWNKNKIFEKSLEKNQNSGKNFVFYEGPPTANGKPGIHHVEARSFKDIIIRYKTMQGYNVTRQAGWDCHGLPVELQVEKKLGISGKPQIEKYGIKEFNALCRKSVYEYVDDWTKLTKRMGYWVDTDNAYETMDNKYIEIEWQLLKEMWEKGFLYEDYKVVPYCPRCGTSLSSHELALGYKEDVEDPSIFVKFQLRDDKNTYFLAWTTTPWTLPGNVALAVDENENYVKLKINNEILILSEKRARELKIKGIIVGKVKGRDLLSIEYKPLFDFIVYDQKSHFVIPADFVSMDEGTGIVHTAVMYGEDDFRLGEKYGLPKKHSVNEKGEFVDEVKPWAGKFVKSKALEKEIIKTLDKNGNLFKAETVKHTYPFCWRCDTPLLYYAMVSWYLKTSQVKDQLIANNASVNWVPDHIKDGRMDEWLKNNRDWALSRSRYWGAPLPVWRCEECSHSQVVGSLSELSKLAKKDLSQLDLHRPFVDEVTFKCDKCGGIMHRVDFVLDCWFDSGAMPYASGVNSYPADFISEAIDQTRGWFYTLQAEAALLGRESPYKNVICLGHLLDEKGNKMSKSKGNVIDPWEIMNSVGADATRWYMYSVVSPGPSFRFSEDLVREVVKRFFLILWNSYNYFVTYANIKGWSPDTNFRINNILDKWILLKIQELVKKVTVYLDKYDLYNATHEIENFITKDFSQWYIRRSRGRTDDGFYTASYKVLVTVSKLIAPFAPFVSEAMYRNLTKEESVHLSNWPSEEVDITDSTLLKKMELVRKLSELGHAIRKEKGVNLRQPLAGVYIEVEKGKKISKNLKKILLDELNVRKFVSRKPKGFWENSDSLGNRIYLDPKITPDLVEDYRMRELARKIQVERKRLGTKLNERIVVSAPWIPKDSSLFNELKERVGADKIVKGKFEVKRIS